MSDALTQSEAEYLREQERRDLRERLLIACLPEMIRGTGIHIGRAEVRAKLAGGAVDLADQLILKLEGDA